MKRLGSMPGAALALAVAACGGGSGTGPGTCSIAVSGAVTASTTCQLAVATTAANGGKVTVGLEALAGTTVIAFQAKLPQTTLQTGTYGSSGSTVTSAQGTVTTSAGSEWVQFYKTGALPDTGSFTLTLSSTGGTVPSGAYTGWPDPGGTLAFTLTAQAGTSATGTVSVLASF